MNCPNCTCETTEHELLMPGFNQTPVFLCHRCHRLGIEYPCAVQAGSELAKSMNLKIEEKIEESK